VQPYDPAVAYMKAKSTEMLNTFDDDEAAGKYTMFLDPGAVRRPPDADGNSNTHAATMALIRRHAHSWPDIFCDVLAVGLRD
jgi:hypothetical protein